MKHTGNFSNKASELNFQKSNFLTFLAVIAISLFPVQFGLKLQTFVYGVQVDIWRVCVFVLFYGLLLKCLARKELPRIVTSSVDKWVYIFCSVLVSSIFWSKYPLDSLREAVDLLVVIAYYIVLINILHARSIFWKTWFTLTPWINMSLAVIYSVYYGGLRVGSISEEAISISNLVAITSVMSMPGLWASAIVGGPLLRKLNLVGLIINILIVFLSESRTGTVIMLISIIVSCCFLSKNGVRSFSKSLLIIFLIAVSSIIVLKSQVGMQTYNELLDRMSRTRFTTSIEEARFLKHDIGRAYEYKSARIILQENLLFGIGLRSFKSYIEERFLLPRGWIAHGFPIEILTNVGLIGSISFIILIFCIFKGLKINPRFSTAKGKEENIYNTALTISFISFMLHSLFRPMITEPYFYIFCAIFSYKNRKISRLS